MKWNCVILIPALNPPDSFAVFLEELQKHGFEDIIVVDDGSREEKQPLFRRAEQIGCRVLHHQRRRGKGAALKTGLACYQQFFQGDRDGVVTVGTGGKHPVEDVERIALALREERRENSAALILGTRDFAAEEMPRSRRRRNGAYRLAYRFLLGIQIQDTLTGLRGIPDRSVADCLGAPGNGYEYETSMLLVCETAGYREVAVKTMAGDPAREHPYRTVDTLRVSLVILRKFLMFTMVSIGVSVFDIFLFWLFAEHFLTNIPYTIVWSTIIARVISASVNYVINRRLVFQSNEDRRKSAGQFIVLSIVQCLLSAGLVQLLELLTGGDAVLLKVIVDTLLFFANYKVQHTFIFHNK